ncbi:hypothetical protein F5Y16DRAFT_418183 [Xylariaceae sp. FL0255]|nr:hypothetical protein F5Y16DRAFT_418183 [Xylariaceae sp. FL0255]
MNPSNFNQESPLPYLTIGDDNAAFDFSTYFQEEGMDYLTDNASQGSTSVVHDATSASKSASPPSPSALSRQDSSPKPRLERRGHTKSRRGCYNCKRRRIKCQETRPACGHCVKTGLKCEYPVAPTVVHQPRHLVPLFTLQDMRFFQHFLQACIPNAPLGCQSIWTHEIPYLSHNHEYLMHALLGLAASDLIKQDPNLIAFAMAHRLKAIKAIKKSLELPRMTSFEESNAMLATCYALSFQSVYLNDGLVEFMTFCRGIVIVAIQIYTQGAKFLLPVVSGQEELNTLQPLIECLPLPRQEWLDMGVASFAALQHLCQQQVEIEYHGYLMDITNTLYTSATNAWLKLCTHYGWWMNLPHETFQSLIDPNNQTCLLLATHWVALKQVMVTYLAVRRQLNPVRHDANMGQGTRGWLKHSNQQIDAEHQQYNQWPLWVEAQLDIDPTYFGTIYD